MATIRKIEFINEANVFNRSIFRCVNGSTEIEQYGDVFIEESNGNKLKTEFLFKEEEQEQILNQFLEHIENAERACLITKKTITNLTLRPSNEKQEAYNKEKVMQIIEYNLESVCIVGAINSNSMKDWCTFLQNNLYLDEFIRSQYLHSIDVMLSKLARCKENIKKFLSSLNELQKYLGLATYRSLLNSTKGKQKGTLNEITNVEEGEKTKNLAIIANLVDQDETLSQEARMRIFSDIDKSTDEKKAIYEINRWLGQKLSKRERRLLKVIRYIAYKQIKKEDGISTQGAFLYQLEISMSELYEEWGCKPRSKKQGGGYDNNQTKVIKELLFGDQGKNLYKDMLFKHGRVIRTRYILQIEEIKKAEQLVGVKIALPAFLFVFDEDIKDEKEKHSFIYQDPDGYRRFITPKGMEQNETAFELAEYLEEMLSCKLEKRLLDLSTMIKEAGLERVYKTRPARAIDKINKILDKMKEAKYLISDWKFDIKGGKYRQGQYEVYNIRANLFLSHTAKNNYSNNSKKVKKLVNKIPENRLADT